MNRSYEQMARDALAGSAVPISGNGMKLVFFALHPEAGTDIQFAESLEIRFAARGTHSKYDIAEAKEFVGGIIGEARGTIGEVLDHVYKIPERTIEPGGGFPSWSHGPRLVWLRGTPNGLRIAIRSTATVDLGDWQIVSRPVTGPLSGALAADG